MSIGISLKCRARTTPGLNPTVPAYGNRLLHPTVRRRPLLVVESQFGAVIRPSRSGPTSRTSGAGDAFVLLVPNSRVSEAERAFEEAQGQR
jgi:hypothetical protein